MPTILVVDDEAAITHLLDELLTEEGYAVRRARDGQEALAVLATEAVDLVLSDVMMPRLDGRGLSQAMQAEAAWQGIPLVLMTAGHVELVGPAVVRQAVIHKPFDLGVILDTVARVLRGRAPHPTGGADVAGAGS